uniref:Uncharacterized protein n=1 Tax=Rhizophora mucronata TaxID=61149 RepID=A0A2P2NA72_RHIMU
MLLLTLFSLLDGRHILFPSRTWHLLVLRRFTGLEASSGDQPVLVHVLYPS